MRRLTVAWHPNAVKTAIEHAAAITSAAENPDAVFTLPGGRITWMDLACLVDAARAAIGGVGVDWQGVVLKLARTEGVAFYRLTTPEVEALRQLLDDEQRQNEATRGVPRD